MICSFIRRSNLLTPLFNKNLGKQSFCSLALNRNQEQMKNQEQMRRPDKLFKKVDLEIRSNDVKVIESYVKFLEWSSKNLDINFSGPFFEKYGYTSNKRYRVERQICLRSAFVHKKHREQYEWRTYILICKLINLTESTLETYLEYIERNLPEGCSMIVHKWEAIKMFDHLQPPTDQEHKLIETDNKINEATK